MIVITVLVWKNKSDKNYYDNENNKNNTYEMNDWNNKNKHKHNNE